VMGPQFKDENTSEGYVAARLGAPSDYFLSLASS